MRDSRSLLLGAFGLGLGLSITLAQTALALLAIRLIWRVATGRVGMHWPLAWAFGAWIGASVLAAAASYRPLESLVDIKSLLLIAGFYVVLDALPDASDAERWWSRLLIVMGLLGIVGVLQVGLCPWLAPLEPILGRIARKCHRAHAFYSIYMTFAGVLSLVLLASLPSLVGAGQRWRVAAWLGGLAGLVATFVRGAWVGFVAGVAALLMLSPRRRLVVGGTLLVLVAAILVVPAARQRAESIVDPRDPTARERWAMWGSAIAMAGDHPLTGVGPAQVKRVYSAYAAPEILNKTRGHVHNTPLQILAERGMLGLAAWLALFGSFFARGVGVLRSLPPAATRERALVAGSLAAITGFLVGGLTEYNFGDSEVALLAYTVMALPFVVARDVRLSGGAVTVSRR